ncbi:MAG: efflux RND transporter permease subunit [Comamonadaceae bacterium]|nr:efflux RND transporter permease subunit [Comamonadaceae bacterium]
MTSLAFILGVVPLAFASGAGAGARSLGRHRGVRRHDCATVLTTLAVPAFYVLIQGLVGTVRRRRPPQRHRATADDRSGPHEARRRRAARRGRGARLARLRDRPGLRAAGAAGAGRVPRRARAAGSDLVRRPALGRGVRRSRTARR